MGNTSPQFRMADRLAGGRLREEIAERRQRGESFEQIARELYAEHGIEVTRQTLAGWWVDLTTEPTDGEALETPKAAAG